MKRLRRLIFWFAFIIIIVSLVLLMNMTAPNPTGRRYSSQAPLMTGEGTGNQIGADGERVLGIDLKLPNNNKLNPRKALCATKYKTIPLPKNVTCIVFSEEIENYRIPDFVGDGFIAESKNARLLDITQPRDFAQIQEFAAGAKELDYTLWIFVRTNTSVATEYDQLAQSTGGGLVFYFRNKSFVDPVNKAALLSLTVSLMVIGLVLSLEIIDGIRFFRFNFNLPMPKGRSSVAIREHKKSRQARKSFDTYDQFKRDALDNARKTLDDD